MCLLVLEQLDRLGCIASRQVQEIFNRQPVRRRIRCQIALQAARIVRKTAIDLRLASHRKGYGTEVRDHVLERRVLQTTASLSGREEDGAATACTAVVEDVGTVATDACDEAVKD